MQKLDLSGRLANWAIKLGQFDLEFIPRNAIKGQALADFLVEFTNMPEIEELDMERKWVVYVDGSSTKKKGGAGIVLFTPDGEELSSSLRLEFKTTNNEAEYEAVMAGLELALELGANYVEMRSDSQVIVGHIRGEFEAKGEKMKKYLDHTKNSTRQLHESIVIEWMCKYECRTHRESALLKINFKMPKLKIP
jgi:ribonuclease HI